MSSHHFYQNDVRIVVMLTEYRKFLIKALTKVFQINGILNYVIVYRESEWKVFTYNQFNMDTNIQNASSAMKDIHSLFPDKLANLHGYTFKLAVTNQYPRLIFGKGKFLGIDESVFSEIIKRQNASMAIEFILPPAEPQKVKIIFNILTERKADLTLNTFFHETEVLASRLHVNTYDVSQYCALIPIPPRQTLLHYLLTPFDDLSWICFYLSIFICGWF